MQPLPIQSISQPASTAAGGFTLIELMIAVVVVGILAAIAYPAYQKQVMRGRRSDAVSALGSWQQAQERYRANNQSYAASFDLLACSATSTAPCPYATGAASAPSNNGYYTVTISAGASGDLTTGYTLTATPVASGLQAADTDCASMQMQMTGGNAVYTSSPSSSCWPQ